MNKKMKTKMFIEAVVVTAIAFALIMPSGAGLTNEKSTTIPEGAVLQTIIDTKQEELLKQNPSTLALGDDIWLTPFEGDDYLPAITVDGMNNVVVVWTNEESFTTSYQGITYSSTPNDEQSWHDNAVVYSWSMENPWGWDIASITGDYYTGLAGCAFDLGEETQIGFQIDDITDQDNTLQAWTWSGDALEAVSCETIDQPCQDDQGITGWHDALVFHFVGMGYDLPGCPDYFLTDPIANSGSSYFDGQENVDTSPSNAYDFCIKGPDTTHHVMSNEETGKIVWKMTKFSVEADIEYTPFQSEIADGAYGQMAGNADTVLITYIDGGTVKAIYSADDGSNWETSTIGTGNFANVCELNGAFFCVYTNDGNLYLSSSEDDGATWSTGEQVNDVDGTVVDGHKYFDIHKGGIVWTDERNEDWDVYYRGLESGPAPFLTIEGIAGGIGVSANIKNLGDAEATNVKWTISLGGTVFLGGETTDTINSIGTGKSASIKSGFPLGFGDIDISITATCDEGVEASASASGKLLLFFVTGL